MDSSQTPIYDQVKTDLSHDPEPVMARDLSWQALTAGSLKQQPGKGRRAKKK